MYRLTGPDDIAIVRLLGSGAILPEVVAAAELLNKDWGIEAEVFSVTSFSELAREAREIEREQIFDANAASRRSHVETLLAGSAPIIAATDYVRAYPQLIASYVSTRFVALGTDGFGRSDTRQALRAFFEVDRHHIVVAALSALASEGKFDRKKVAKAIDKYELKGGQTAPWLR
jgi:pyruvate dehydrogenase E1 component